MTTSLPSLTKMWYSDEIQQVVGITIEDTLSESNLYVASTLGKWQQILTPDEYFAQNPTVGNGVWVFSYGYRSDFHEYSYIFVSSYLKGSSWNVTYQYTYASFSLSDPLFVNGNFYVANVDSLKVMKSSTGYDWESINIPSECIYLWATFSTNDQLYLVCADVEDNPYTYAYNFNSNSWNTVQIVVPDQAFLYEAFYINDIYVAIDTRGNLYYSSDGMDWTVGQSPLSSFFTPAVEMIAYSNGIYVAANSVSDIWTATET